MTRDRVIALALLALAWGEQVSGGRERLWLHLVMAALMALPLGFARRRPWLPAAAGAIALVAYGAMGTEPDATGEIFALAGAAFVAGSRMPLWPAVLVLAGLSAAAVVHLSLLGGLADLGFVVGVFLLPPLLLGRAVRSRRRRIEELVELNRRLAEERERSARLAAEVERARIGRDLEQLVASALDGMVARAAEGERQVDSDPAAAAAGFEAIRAQGAEATGELRRLLRLLHA